MTNRILAIEDTLFISNIPIGHLMSGPLPPYDTFLLLAGEEMEVGHIYIKGWDYPAPWSYQGGEYIRVALLEPVRGRTYWYFDKDTSVFDISRR